MLSSPLMMNEGGHVVMLGRPSIENPLYFCCSPPSSPPSPNPLQPPSHCLAYTKEWTEILIQDQVCFL